ncbi:MAG: hypothetical protein JNN07_15375 [Verrucomicrobiales bacterium]|nr:hypothetical protein [Verrucomicrobiales bacterium]
MKPLNLIPSGSFLFLAAFICSALFSPSRLSAQIHYTWVGGGGFWSTPANWFPAGIPGPSDSATIASGTPLLDASASVSNLVLSASNGGISGGAQAFLTVLHSGSWSAGSITRVRMTIAPECTFVFEGGAKSYTGGAVTNQGTIRWNSGALSLENNQYFMNRKDGLIEVTFGGAWLQNGAGTSILHNEGTYVKTGSDSTNSIRVVSFINSGTVRAADRGTIRFETRTFQTSGAGNGFVADDGAQIELPAGLYENTHFAGVGVKRLDTGNFQATLTGVISATNLIYANGYCRGAATLDGTLEWRGGILSPNLTILPQSTLLLAGNGSKTLANSGFITNAGTTRWIGGPFNLENNSTFHNLPTGLFEVSVDGNLLQAGAGTSTFRNEGVYRKTSTRGTNTIQIVAFVQSGRLEVLTGTVRVVGNSTFSPGSVIRTRIGGPDPGQDFGQLQVTGSAALSGALELELANGFTPATNQTFAILTCGSRTGTFSSFQGGFIADGFYFRPSYTTAAVQLEVINGVARLVSPTKLNGAFSSRIQGVINGVYQIESSTNLVDWAPLGTTIIPIGGLATWTDPAPATLPLQYYRAVFQP